MSAAARGRVTAARVRGGRVLLDVTLVSGDTRSRVEMLQPYGFTAVPTIGSEVLVQQLAYRGHLVALLADAPALRVTDAGPGEIGIRDQNGQQVVFRADRIEVTAQRVEVASAETVTVVSTGAVVVQAPTIRLGSAGATKAVALHGDSIIGGAGGTVQASAGKVFAE